MRLLDILRRFRRGIFVALVLVVIEHVAWIAEPAAFGPVIDAWLEKDVQPHAHLLVPLGIWIGLFAVNSIVGSLRRSIDQRIYLRMYADIAAIVARTAQEQKLSMSQTAARADLSRQFITFFQYRVPEVLEQVIAIGGALVSLAFFDWRISLACFFVTVPIVITIQVYRTKVTKLQSSVHDTMEHSYEMFATQDPERVRAYYLELAKPQQKIANWGAGAFGMVRFFLLLIFLVVLYVAIDLDNFSTGNIYSIVAYIWTFITSSEYLPELLESWTALRDISARLRAEED